MQDNKKLDNVLKLLENGMKDIFTSDNYKNYLKCVSSFHSYSINNTMLIALQRPTAAGNLVAGYNTWKKLGRQVCAGEKAIRIMAPMTHKKKVMQEKRDALTGSVIRGSDGRAVMEEKEISFNTFRPVAVFAYDQTEGEDLPSLGVNELFADVSDYRILKEVLEEVSPVAVRYEKIDGGAKGYYSGSQKLIVVDNGMSELQTIKTLCHEIAHALLHDSDGTLIDDVDETTKSKGRKEVEAESVAFVVMNHFNNIDTSDYSFGYIAEYSAGKEMNELVEAMDTIRKTASHMITEIDKKLTERGLIRTDKGINVEKILYETEHAPDEMSVMDRLKLAKELMERNAKSGTHKNGLIR